MLLSAPYPDAVLSGLILALIALAWAIFLVRIIGLRSFSKMTNFDFVSTVAMGSLLAGATQTSEWTGFVQSLAGMGGLMGAQYIVSKARYMSPPLDSALQNSPTILMRNGTFIPEALEKTRVKEDDVIAKLREANALSLTDVRYVVLETTGDISVLHGSQVDDVLVKGLA